MFQDRSLYYTRFVKKVNPPKQPILIRKSDTSLCKVPLQPSIYPERTDPGGRFSSYIAQKPPETIRRSEEFLNRLTKSFFAGL